MRDEAERRRQHDEQAAEQAALRRLEQAQRALAIEFEAGRDISKAQQEAFWASAKFPDAPRWLSQDRVKAAWRALDETGIAIIASEQKSRETAAPADIPQRSDDDDAMRVPPKNRSWAEENIPNDRRTVSGVLAYLVLKYDERQEFDTAIKSVVTVLGPALSEPFLAWFRGRRRVAGDDMIAAQEIADVVAWAAPTRLDPDDPGSNLKFSKIDEALSVLVPGARMAEVRRVVPDLRISDKASGTAPVERNSKRPAKSRPVRREGPGK